MTAVERLRAGGIVRCRSGRTGFRYRLAAGGRPDREALSRIRSLRLPPAWHDVAIATSPRARLQAVGRDRAGRWQYVYHPAHVRRRERHKHARLIRFGAALPRFRRAVVRDLRRRGLPRDKVLAVVMRILSRAFLRPGSEVYAAANGSFGIATIRRKHTRVVGDAVHFDFPGKSGQRQRRTVRDREVASVVKRLLAIAGYEVFKYVDERGRVVDLKSADINEYIKRTLGPGFSAKDFRTWAGTLICANSLARAHATQRPDSPRAVRRALAAAMRETAAQLGNTPAVCRTAYVSASVPEAFACGRVIARAFDEIEDVTAAALERRRECENALLALLKDAPQPTASRTGKRHTAVAIAGRQS
jgi:DNA topoisomerase-1